VSGPATVMAPMMPAARVSEKAPETGPVTARAVLHDSRVAVEHGGQAALNAVGQLRRACERETGLHGGGRCAPAGRLGRAQASDLENEDAMRFVSCWVDEGHPGYRLGWRDNQTSLCKPPD
jgi:hypothetical protein